MMKVRFDEVFRPEHIKKMLALFDECLTGKTKYPFRNHLIDELIMPQWPAIKHDMEGKNFYLDQLDLATFMEQLTYRLYYGKRGSEGAYFNDEEKIRLAAFFFYCEEVEETGESVEDVMGDMRQTSPKFIDTVFFSGIEEFVREYNEELKAPK